MTIVSKGTGTLSVAVDKDLRSMTEVQMTEGFRSLTLKTLVTLKTLKSLLRVAEGRMSREDDALAEGLVGTEPRGVAKAKSYQRRALTI